ncbi:hypothetical protein [Candidatus Pelagibacter communis]|uniref:hypothetical protein n=1 Tax=Candidatus Pelagibacter TaxID=198251 RepID=UPI003EE0E6B3
MSLLDLFHSQELNSSKYKNYFPIYENLFKRYRDKKITFVEIGTKDGGSLLMWKKFFSNKSRIIGIDINIKANELEKYGVEIFIGDQADNIFWKNFFEKVGKVDIVLDDGGHTNTQQIITVENTVKNINDGGMLVIEDTFTSYMNKFANPNKYSFINYTKKKIDDINYRYPNIGKLKNSINKYVYSIEFFESAVCFKIDTSKCLTNEDISNNKKILGVEDLRHGNQRTVRNLRKSFSFLYKIKILRLIAKYFLIKIVNYKIKIQNRKNKKFFI